MHQRKKQKADITISDWHMPVADGLEFYKEVSKEELIKNALFQVVTKVFEAVKNEIKGCIINRFKK